MVHKKNKWYQLEKIAAIGNHLPRQCGIATFTSHLCDALSAEMEEPGNMIALAMDDIVEGYDYPERVKFEIRANVQSDYIRAAEFLNVNRYDIAILQHEFGIFGGKLGSHIIHLLKALRMPILTTLHSVVKNPSLQQRTIISELAKYSDRLVVLSQKSHDMLLDIYKLDKRQVAFIPHGIPDVPFSDPDIHKEMFELEGRKVLLTFGLLGPGKGIEYMLYSMPEIIKAHPDVIYIVLGGTHPHIKRTTGDSYRAGLLQLVNKLGIEDNVRFYNRFVSLDLLCQYIDAADVYVTPYISQEQAVSGTLSYALGAGAAVVSTPYWHAQELLAENRGVLVPFKDSGAMASEIIKLLSNDEERNAMRKRAYKYCRPMVWKEVARKYMDLGREVLDYRTHHPKPKYYVERTAKILEELPDVNMSHMKIMTDGVGMLQHSDYSTPNRNHGYCVDDNARAIIAACMYMKLNEDSTVLPMIQTYLSFILHAFNPDNGRFRNFMSYDRRWLEDAGSEDSHGRTLWGLGITVKYAPDPSIRKLASRLFMDALPVVEDFIFSRAWSFTLVGLDAYLEVYSGDGDARRMRVILAEKLHDAFTENSVEEWPWCDDILTYANAKIPHALLLAGQWIPEPKMCETGLRALEWLLELQTTKEGHLSIIGNKKWFRRGGERSTFDQQPIDAMALVEACAPGDRKWIKESIRCLSWFLGRNDLNVQIYNFETGGCFDGLEALGINPNQGAESTLAWLISLLTIMDVMGTEKVVKKKD